VQMEARWCGARQVLTQVADARLAALSSEHDALLDAFAGLYPGHLQAEDEIAYPAAQGLLDDAQRSAMGAEMMRRRGVS
jgi:hypothetical protein